jgi:hypothetical protein
MTGVSLHHAGRKYHKHCRDDPWAKRDAKGKSRQQKLLKDNKKLLDRQK